MSIYHVTEERKMRDKRGKGTGADYKPWIYVREIKSDGTSSEPIDWTNGRTCQLLSQGEKYLWYYLRWDDSVKNIYEQYPLNLDATNSIGYNRCIIIFISPSLCFYNNIIISTSFRWKIYSITIFFKQFHSVYILIIKKVIKNTPCFFHGHLRYF